MHQTVEIVVLKRRRLVYIKKEEICGKSTDVEKRESWEKSLPWAVVAIVSFILSRETKMAWRIFTSPLLNKFHFFSSSTTFLLRKTRYFSPSVYFTFTNDRVTIILIILTYTVVAWSMLYARFMPRNAINSSFLLLLLLRY